ncbi:hypothetical protein J2X69_001092 [Algoriphagus sp. 4150]|uniref:hypothetical protein n=1 Tax=Algoriphagus sp. 4150 TaxID=2817756 RepID=UPI00285B61E0|nr:hypothetical protein [Algoriphagus sp. 4150]MDR7128760.1 hypothetical protein [Algoriphagus sp. 4150]
MKNLFNISLPVLLITGISLLSSCDVNDDPAPNLSVMEENITASMAFEDLNNLTLTVHRNFGLSARTTENIPSGNICEGAVVTLDEAAKKIIVDFGEGCTGTGGAARKGKVTFSYTGNLMIPGAKTTTEFDGYEVNGLKLEGTRILTNKGSNLETNSFNFEAEIQNGKVTWPDGTNLSVESNQLRDMKFGAQGEYEISVTGTASGTSRGGFEYTSSTSTALVYKKSCIDSGVTAPLSGITNFQFRGIETSVDYGDGTCDKLATYFYPNSSRQVTLD